MLDVSCKKLLLCRLLLMPMGSCLRWGENDWNYKLAKLKSIPVSMQPGRLEHLQCSHLTVMYVAMRDTFKNWYAPTGGDIPSAADM